MFDIAQLAEAIASAEQNGCSTMEAEIKIQCMKHALQAARLINMCTSEETQTLLTSVFTLKEGDSVEKAAQYIKDAYGMELPLIIPETTTEFVFLMHGCHGAVIKAIKEADLKAFAYTYNSVCDKNGNLTGQFLGLPAGTSCEQAQQHIRRVLDCEIEKKTTRILHTDNLDITKTLTLSYLHISELDREILYCAAENDIDDMTPEQMNDYVTTMNMRLSHRGIECSRADVIYLATNTYTDKMHDGVSLYLDEILENSSIIKKLETVKACTDFAKQCGCSTLRFSNTHTIQNGMTIYE